MVNQQQRHAGSTFILDKLIAVVLVVWLLFGGGFSQVKTWLTPDRLNQVGQIADTIKTGAGRVVAPNAAPAAKPGAVVPRLPSNAPPSAGQLPANLDAANAAADAAYQATAQAAEAQIARDAGNVASAPAQAPVIALPTAVVLIPTVPPLAQITIVPQSMPVVYAQSAPIVPTPIPTLVYPTLIPAALANYSISPDGKCVIVTRDGAAYQQCQDWKYSPAEAASVADYLRTGLLPGTKVP